MRYVNDIGHIAEHDIYWNYFDKGKRKLCEDASFNPTPAKQCPPLHRHDCCRRADRSSRLVLQTSCGLRRRETHTCTPAGRPWLGRNPCFLMTPNSLSASSARLCTARALIITFHEKTSLLSIFEDNECAGHVATHGVHLDQGCPNLSMDLERRSH